jgi:hypothetical protein
MRQTLSVAAALAAMLAGAASPVPAQQRIPAVELGVYGGGAWSSEWLGINEDFVGLTAGEDAEGGGFGIGVTPQFGANASWYLTPTFGLRLHGSYMPSEFPTRDEDAGVAAFGALGPAVVSVNALEADDSGYPLNNWLADASLVFRPYVQSRSDWLASTYFFLGGGVMVTDVAGNGDPGDLLAGGEADCVDAYEALGACLAYEPDYSTVGQGTAGFGLNFFPLGGRLGLFGELAVHAYDSPFHTPDEDESAFASTLAEDRFVWTPRAALGVKLSLGDLSPPVVVAPPANPVPVPTPAPAPAPEERPLTVCVVEGERLTSVAATYLPETEDTVVMVQGQRRPFSEMYPIAAPDYAAGTTWYVNGDEVRLQDRDYVRFGVPRLITGTTQLQRVGDFEGVGVFAETGAETPYPVLYVPLRPGCEFQPYQLRDQIRVRG